jgi:glycoside/pentoside/hexuronide:cation symporter, GPH family
LSETSSTIEVPPLRLSAQVGYAVAEIGQNLVETLIRIYLLKFYTDVVGLDAMLAGLAFAISLVWDACIDPCMGTISDRTLHRFGGRRGYLPLGAGILAIGLLAIFHPPAMTTQASKFGWLLMAACLLGTGMTVLSVPYMAMGGEITENPHERAVLFGWRFAFANVGAVFAAALPTFFLQPGETNSAVLKPVSSIAAIVVVVTAAISWWATRNLRANRRPANSGSFLSNAMQPFRNPAFRPLIAVYVIATIGIGINSATALYYYQYRLGLTELQIQGILVLFILVFTTSILVWVKLAKRFGKRRPMAFGSLFLGFGTAGLYLVAPPGDIWFPLIGGGVFLGSLVGCVVLIDTLLTDVIDHDQVHSKQLRSGMYFGVWRFASKLARAIAIGVAGWLLSYSGFVPNQAQTQEVERTLVLLFGPGVGVFFVVAGIQVWMYRFDERKQAQVRRILDRRMGRTARSIEESNHKVQIIRKPTSGR